jgi:hypothetical protein
MCSICKQFICASSCPNAPLPKPVDYCSGCGAPIFEGDDYYETPDEQKWCEKCIRYKTA